MPLEPISEADFQAASARWPYYARRWGYFRLALQFAGSPSSVLELGPHRLPLFPAGDTMDRKAELLPTYRHDASVTPWPVEQHYDLFIGLQVWEHLGASQAMAFWEVMRVADRAVLSFPYRWDCPADLIHHGIDDAVIGRWTCGVPWQSAAVAIRGRRMVCYWEF